MKFFKKLLPQKIDQMIYVLKRDEHLPILDVGFQIEDSSIRRFHNFKKNITRYEFSLNAIEAYNCNSFEKVHFLKCINQYYIPVIGDCFTMEKFRGKSIYPFMLQVVAKELLQKSQKVFVLVSPENKASIRGIEKSGFILFTRISAIRIGMLYFRKRISYFNK